MKRFTVTVSDEGWMQAKLAAVKAQRPLVHWAGDVIEQHLARINKSPKGKAK